MPEVRIPDYPELAADFYNAFVRHVQQLSRSNGVLSAIRTTVIHEGKASQIKRAESSVYEPSPIKEFSTESRVGFAEIDRIRFDRIVDEAIKISLDLRNSISSHLFDTLNEVTAKTGQVVDGRGSPLTADLIYKMFEMMPQEYDTKTGKPSGTIVTSPQMAPAMIAIEKQIMDDPDLRKKFAELEAKKRDEFRNREMDRDLVG